MKFDRFLETLQHKVPENIQQSLTIIAGHYCLSEELAELSSEGDSEQLSFEAGLVAYNHFRALGRRCHLVLWINNIGISPGQRQEMNERFEIPDSYKFLLAKHGVADSDVEILFESTARNKASVWFRKIYSRSPERFKVFESSDYNLIRCIDPTTACTIDGDVSKAYTVETMDGKPLVMKEGSNPKCNLILATLFATLLKRDHGTVFLNIFNDIYIDRIRLGIYVAEKVYDAQPVFVNWFTDGEQLFYEDFK